MMKAWRLRKRPVAEIAKDDLELCTEPLPTPGPGQMLVKNELISIDPTHRIWMSDRPQYMPCVELNDVMRAATVGVVEKSENPEFPVGTRVFGFGGCQEYYLGIPGATVLFATTDDAVAACTVFNPIILMAAWHGLVKIINPGPDSIVVVSGAAGAVGSLVGQLAKVRGAKVIGICGTDEKGAWLKELGFDCVINYKTQDVQKEIAAFAPDGITGYFDNVGGAITDAVFANARNNAKVALCGSISEYNLPGEWPGQKNYNMILMRRITVTGFICLDHMNDWAECKAEVEGLLAKNTVKYKSDIREGLASYVDVVNALTAGTNTGKLCLKP